MQVIEATQEVKAILPQFSGPAARIEVVRPGGNPQVFIVFRDYPKFDEERGGDLVFAYGGADEKFYTGLQVARDPGVWVVWFGCALMVIGICMAFFLSHKRIWIKVVNGRVTIGGTASKNQPAFQLFFDDLVSKLKNV